MYDELPKEAKVEIVTEGGWEPIQQGRLYGPQQSQQVLEAAAPKPNSPNIEKPYVVLTALGRRLAQEPNAEYERALVRESLAAIEAWRHAGSVDPGPGYFRPVTPKKARGDPHVL